MSKGIMFIRIIFALFTGCLLSFVFTKYLIKKGNNKQIEREYLETHKVKSGTVSMGGIALFFSTLISFLLSSLFLDYNYKILSLIFVSTMFFVVGYIDDISKNKFKSYKGLSAKLRILIEIVILIYFIIILRNSNINLSIINVPIVNMKINISWIYILFVGFVLIGSSNSLNLSDGLDGLASGLTMIALTPFILLSLKMEEYMISIYLASLVGAIMGFLYFNFPKAKIFMGDCGSLYLGSVMGATSIILRNELLLFISGFLFVIEAISVIIQVGYFKLSKKRVFLMTPLHHHFEKKGIDEVRVVMGFYLVGIFFSILGVIICIL